MSELLAESILLGLIVWRVTNWIHYEEGPLGIFARVQSFFYERFERGSIPQGVVGAAGYLLFQAVTCFSCTIAVVGGGAAALTSNSIVRFFTVWLAISAVARFMDYLIVPPIDQPYEADTLHEEVPHG